MRPVFLLSVFAWPSWTAMQSGIAGRAAPSLIKHCSWSGWHFVYTVRRILSENTGRDMRRSRCETVFNFCPQSHRHPFPGTGPKMDEEPQGERGESPGEGPSLSLSKVSAGWGSMVHTLSLDLLLLPLRGPAGRPVLPSGAVHVLCCKRSNRRARERQRLQGKRTSKQWMLCPCVRTAPCHNSVIMSPWHNHPTLVHCYRSSWFNLKTSLVCFKLLNLKENVLLSADTCSSLSVISEIMYYKSSCII